MVSDRGALWPTCLPTHIFKVKLMRYLIMEGEFPSMTHLPARETRDEAQKECDRMNKIVVERNESYERHSRDLKDDRKFSVKEIA